MIYTTDLSFVTGKQASKQGNILLDLLSPSIRSISGLKMRKLCTEISIMLSWLECANKTLQNLRQWQVQEDRQPRHQPLHTWLQRTCRGMSWEPCRHSRLLSLSQEPTTNPMGWNWSHLLGWLVFFLHNKLSLRISQFLIKVFQIRWINYNGTYRGAEFCRHFSTDQKQVGLGRGSKK